MTWILGTELHPDDQAYVLRAFVHRMTIEARREWPDVAARMIRHGYRLPAQEDAEWLRTTRFAVTRRGRLDRRVRWCQSHGI